MIADACTNVAKVIGKAYRDGKPGYYINDGVYHTYSDRSSTTATIRLKRLKQETNKSAQYSDQPATHSTR